MTNSKLLTKTDKNALYEENKHIVTILMHKYFKIATSLNIDLKEFEQEAYYAFSNAINTYRPDKNTQLNTFITLCIERRLKKIIKKYNRDKAKIMKNTFSLDYDYNLEGSTLKDCLSDNQKNDPLNNLTNQENYHELLANIKTNLSESEYEIFTYMINGFDYVTIAKLTNRLPKQIDNTIQRIKHKIRDIILSD